MGLNSILFPYFLNKTQRFKFFTQELTIGRFNGFKADFLIESAVVFRDDRINDQGVDLQPIFQQPFFHIINAESAESSAKTV